MPLGGNGNTGGSVPIDYASYQANDVVTVLGNTGFLVRTGYTFAGWNASANGSGTSYSAGDTFTIGNSNVTLYAQWVINEYTLSFDSMGGTAVGSITQEFGTAITEPVDPTRTGYFFAGWVPAVPTHMPAENLTLVAQWDSVTLPETGSVTSVLNNIGGLRVLFLGLILHRRRY